MKERFLPIGTVVILKGAQKKLMITGFTPIDMNKRDKMYDYCGCIYPEGVLNNNNFLFNHDEISEVFFEGYVDDEQKEFSKKLKEFIDKEGKELQSKLELE